MRRYRGGLDEPLKVWFAREILVHEAALVRFLQRTWPRRDEVHDLRQEVYVRVYEAARKSRPTAPKAFLFTTARHLLTDRIRRRRIISIEAVSDIEQLNVLIDEVSPERRINARQELRRLARALNVLPPKCREVVWLRRVDELPQKEVARRLGISERTVESHVQKGMRDLADAFLGNTLDHDTSTSTDASDDDPRHGKQQKD